MRTYKIIREDKPTMPKTPIDYKYCCIYKIEHIDNENLLYVGHTTNFNNRKFKHKSRCNNELDKSYNIKLYQMMRENGGWDMFRMIEIEKYACKDKREAEKRENEIMKELKANMNSHNSFLSDVDRKILNSKIHKEYQKGHRIELNKKQNDYYYRNRDDINDRRKEKVKCECGCEVSKQHKKRHQATKKHIDLINKKI